MNFNEKNNLEGTEGKGSGDTASLVPRPSSRAVDPLPQKLSERKAW